MSFHFINGTSAWFETAIRCEDDKDGKLAIYGKRNKFIAIVMKAHVLFYYFIDAEVMTFGPEKVQG